MAKKMTRAEKDAFRAGCSCGYRKAKVGCSETKPKQSKPKSTQRLGTPTRNYNKGR